MLEIAQLRVTGVRAPLAREFRGSYYRMTHRATIIVQVLTTDGIVGEAYVGDEDGDLQEIAAIIMKEIAPAVSGQSAMNTELCWARSYHVTFDILRNRRLGLVALAGVDTAIWDAVGKALGQPLHRLWGGYRDAIPMIAIGGYYGEPLGTIADEIDFYREAGLAGMKFKVGGAAPVTDVARVRKAREVAGVDFIIVVDANQGYSRDEAIEFARAAADLDLGWFEEPVGWANDRRDLRDVRLLGGMPVAAGQSEFSAVGCRELMEAGAIDVCNFDASWSGGPTVWRRVAAVARTFEVQMGHHEEPQVSTALLASQPHGTYAECFHPDRDPFWWNLIADERRMVNGQLQLSDRPGLGWRLDTDYIEEHHYDLA